jgi:DNA-binding NarL/FixJ family response regulator
LRQTLSETEDIVVVDEAENSVEVLHKLKERRFDVLLLDIAMPGRGGIDVLNEKKSLGIRTPALMLSIFPEDQYAVRALKSGASGYLTKNCDAETLVEAIRKVAVGGTYVSSELAERLASGLSRDERKQPHELLSDREFEVLKQVAAGKNTREIAADLNLSVQTISTYRARIREKMQLKNAAEITSYVMRHRLLEP